MSKDTRVTNYTTPLGCTVPKSVIGSNKPNRRRERARAHAPGWAGIRGNEAGKKGKK